MNSVDEILDFAIDREDNATAFYRDLAGTVKEPELRKLLLEYAEEEKRHKARLLTVKAEGKMQTEASHVADLKIADYTVDVDAGENLTYQDALIVAMKRERVAYRLYADLAEKIEDSELKAVFQALAREEAKHKLYFEREYDERVLKDN